MDASIILSMIQFRLKRSLVLMRTNLWENVSCKGGKGSFFVGSNKTGISKKRGKNGWLLCNHGWSRHYKSWTAHPQRRKDELWTNVESIVCGDGTLNTGYEPSSSHSVTVEREREKMHNNKRTVCVHCCCSHHFLWAAEIEGLKKWLLITGQEQSGRNGASTATLGKRQIL